MALKRSTFMQNVQKLVSGTLVSQLLLLLSTPILTRLYSSEQFGTLSLYMSILGVLSVSASLRYNRAIPLPKKDNDACLIIILGAIIVLFYSVFLFILIITNDFFNIVNFEGITDTMYLYFLPFSVFCVGMYDLYSYWGVRIEKFGILAKGKVLQTLLIVLIQISLFGFGVLSLILGHSLGIFFSFIFLLASFWSEIKLADINFKKILALAKRYVDFPKYSTWEAILNSAGNNAPVIMLSLVLGNSVAGLYALTYKVLSMPLSIIGAAIGQAYFSKAAKSYKAGNVSLLTLNLFNLLCNIGFPLAIFLMLTAPFLFEIAFGNNWIKSGVYAQIMIPWLLLIFLSSPLSSIISVSEEQRKSVVFQIWFLVVKIVSLYLGSIYFDDYITLLILSISSSLLLVFFTIWLLRLASVNLLKAFNAIIKSILFGFLCNTPLIVEYFLFFDQTNQISLFFAILLSVFFVLYRFYYLKRGLFLD